jgi:hypothetical protein
MRDISKELYISISQILTYTQGINLLFHSLEGESKKGPNSVATYLYYVLNFVRYSMNLDSIKQICFFSGAAGGQNRNWVIIKFCVFISVLLDISIVHLYPVRRHSYNICDTNFAVIGKEFKKAVIETPNDYIKII